jgi:hypothetical protein
MTLVISKGITLRNQLPADTEADAYIAAVEAADGQALESGVKFAIKNFVLCCKQDGIWDAIKASCILAGARTLTGALVPLAGTAPTNFNFVAGDYNRKTGLVGDGSTKYLNSNRNNNADPQDDRHAAVYATTRGTTGDRAYLSISAASGEGATQVLSGINLSQLRTRCSDQTSSEVENNLHVIDSLLGISRAASSEYIKRGSGTNETVPVASLLPIDGNYFVLSRNNIPNPGNFSNARLAFYSIGESLDLALLDARVTDLINAFAAAIP